MKKLLFVFAFLSTHAFAQKLTDYGLNRIRINEEEQTLQFETIPATNLSVVRPDRTYYWYSANGIHTTQGGFSGKLLNGYYQAYYLNKNLKEEGFFSAGLKDGTWKNWKPDGSLTQLVNWKNGLRSGRFTLYNDSGQVSTSGHYKKNVMDGHISFNAGRDSARTVRYQNGKEVPEQAPLLQRINIFRKKKPKNN
jgi:antitoxin component YwqK of YwqJK toxin-antitoxin module